MGPNENRDGDNNSVSMVLVELIKLEKKIQLGRKTETVGWKTESCNQ